LLRVRGFLLQSVHERGDVRHAAAALRPVVEFAEHRAGRHEAPAALVAGESPRRPLDGVAADDVAGTDDHVSGGPSASSPTGRWVRAKPRTSAGRLTPE